MFSLLTVWRWAHVAALGRGSVNSEKDWKNVGRWTLVSENLEGSHEDLRRAGDVTVTVALRKNRMKKSRTGWW